MHYIEHKLIAGKHTKLISNTEIFILHQNNIFVISAFVNKIAEFKRHLKIKAMQASSLKIRSLCWRYFLDKNVDKFKLRRILAFEVKKI